MNKIRDELVLVKSMLMDGELEWDLDDENDITRWQEALNDSTGDCDAALASPCFSLRLADGVQLHVEIHQDETPKFALHATGLSREDQARLSAALDEQLKAITAEEPEYPILSVYTSMQEYVTAHPAAPPRPASPKHETASGQQKPDLRTKVVLFWSHHLLATGKRRNIVAWSAELGLWGISKPGYPGVWVVEGLVDDVDEFVYRIKQLNWKALQVRCELESPACAPPSDLPANEHAEWARRHATHLAPVLCKSSQSKVGLCEVEGLDELGTFMTKAGLDDVFKTALKL
ncbi:hypothetical protein ACM66B_000950 [Microbotryomycetes sp. NB124-2]